jgi:myo-inositol-1(or 4)-monophosphatase
MSLDLDHYFSVAAFAATQASRALLAERAGWSAIDQDLGRELKIRGDKEAEAIIVETLRRFAPLPILSEEAGWIDVDGLDLFWAVDPLDGSVNYALGYPHCAVSIALLREGRPVLGVVDCFALGELFSGIVGRGAWLNGRPIKPSTETRSDRGVLLTGLPARAATDSTAMAAFGQEMARWRKVRMIGSAAAALACVACGRGDAYFESGGMLWDVAGGLAIVAAAGGVIDFSGEAKEGPLRVMATNGAEFFSAHEI